MQFFKRFSLFLFYLLILTSCSTAGSTTSDATSNGEPEMVELSIGLMPAVDSAPILLAEQEGYFKDLGLNLESTIYTNANNRQSALQSNALDGTMTDLIAFVNNQHNGFETKIVTSTDGSFSFLTGDNFESAETKKLGLMEVSVSNYLADHYVTTEYNVEKVYIAEIPARLEMLKSGQLDIGFFPEPIASMGELNGLTKHISITDDDGFTPEAMVFTTKALEEKSVAIERFIKGYNKAVEAIEKDESLARDVLIKVIELDPASKDLITIPTYHKARVPSEDYLNKIINWVEQVQEIEVELDYTNMVTKAYLES
ncbi:ABC transporter substrate-binding protein [Paraliobacillus sediminis]|uniref:ABC transporter substrate-binding protein n=1 Tax=Paraliobacillus sediminis TaxID=1885916 RepID=UPI0013C2CAD6|nr:ABC transporter substrate-binding protein [Paraliobacillus sediminis]